MDTDHCARAKEVFHLEHAEKYQGEGRLKIKTMWVPATAILEVGVKGQARTLRAEARHRFKQGKGVRVFGRPEKLDQFLIDNDIDPAKRRNLISDAGTLCPEFNLEHDGAEFFVHSPFAETCGDKIEYRNGSALFMQATFQVEGRMTKMILSADVPHGVIEDIVRITQYHKNDERLEWDINNIPHHSSYLSLSNEKGAEKTVPVDRIKWLYETQGKAGGRLISTSDFIPSEDTVQPPHRQAANYYKGVVNDLGGEWIVSMEHPSETKPKPVVIEIGGNGSKVRKIAGGAPALISSSAPRAGS